ncbi:MAG: ABC transporter ATP-binding protein [Muribaculaceae bacterium]|nr:ABC transporter ATP-binding protein [Muribaculaceae bacterium]
MIEIERVSKYYGALQVLRDVSLTIERGEIVTILGPSGAGKSTLLQICGTLDVPDSGRVMYDGVEVSGLKDKKLSEFRNCHIGFIFQFHELLPEFSAQENVAMPAMIGGESRRVSMSRARELLDKLGLAERLSHRPSELSGGEKQRVAIARALINNPRIVLADEPTGSLDSRNRDEIKRIISDLNAETGQTFMIVTHDSTLSEIAHRTVMMTDGSIF